MVTLLTEGGGVIQMLTLADKGGWGVIQMLTFADRGGGGGVKNGLKYADVILARSLTHPTTLPRYYQRGESKR